MKVGERLREFGVKFGEQIAFYGALLGFFIGYVTFVEWRVSLIVKDPEFIQSIAKRVRPAIVFNTRGVVLSDAGALEHLEKPPEVDVDIPNGRVRITVTPKHFLANEPVLESLDAGAVIVTAERGKGMR